MTRISSTATDSSVAVAKSLTSHPRSGLELGKFHPEIQDHIQLAEAIPPSLPAKQVAFSRLKPASPATAVFSSIMLTSLRHISRDARVV